MDIHVFAHADRARVAGQLEAAGRGHVSLYGSDGRVVVLSYGESDLTELPDEPQEPEATVPAVNELAPEAEPQPEQTEQV